MLADELDYVVGVDTHLDEHVLVVLAAPAGAVIAKQAVPANARGYREALRFVEEHSDGVRAWAVEGAGHYGVGLARFLAGRGESVLEVSRSPRAERRLRGKDDSLDAIRAARALLSSETLTLPRAGERREALRLLLLARRSAVEVRREALVQLRSVIVTAPDRLRDDLRGLPVGRLLERCSRLRRSRRASADELATRLVLRSLARRIEAATTEAGELEAEILGHVRALAPKLLDEPGIGPIVAAQVIIAWSHPGRVRSEAAFARLAGAAPIPASSGQTTRYRLSRGGDRQLNRALHTVILHRRLHDPATKTYIERRVAEGKSRRDAVRLLKRYLARHLYRVLDNQAPLMT
jgi:transposase